jgi:hypothetical protein
MLGKEKVVYILNPDGLTESIFVAKGEPNEGQYRGKRFTKAGLKAEKKRLRDEALKQAEMMKPQTSDVGALVTNEGDGLTFDEYNVDTSSLKLNIKTIKLHGSATGWIGVFDKDAEMILYREFKEGFKAKQDINSAIQSMNIINFNIRFYKNKQGVILFKGEGELEYEVEV